MKSKTAIDAEANAQTNEVRHALNVRLLAVTLAGVVVLAAAGYGWYTWQSIRTAHVYLAEADRLAEEGRNADAAECVFRYLQLRPNDAAARVRLARTFDRGAKGPAAKTRAIELYYQAIAVAPPDAVPELRVRAAELNLEVGRFATSETEARTLLARDAADPTARRLLALALYGQHSSGAWAGRRDEPSAVGQALEDALEVNPGDVELSGLLARIDRGDERLLGSAARALTLEQRARRADEIMDAMVARHHDAPEALLDRHRYRVQFGLADAGADLDAALRQSPDDLAIRLAAADWARRQADAAGEKGALDEVHRQRALAVEHFEKAKSLAPMDERAYIGLGEVRWAEGRRDEAVAAWRDGLERCGASNVQLNACTAEALIALGRLDDAEQPLSLVERATAEIRPDAPRGDRLAMEQSVRLLRGRWLLQKGRSRDAIPLLQEVALGAGGSASDAVRGAQAAMLLGAARVALRQWNAAAVAFDQAASLRPKEAGTFVAAADAWTAAGRPDAAISRYEQAIRLADAPGVRLALATARYQEQLRLPPKRRDWTAFEKALAEAKASAAGAKSATSRPAILEAEYAMTRAAERGAVEQGRREARDALRKVESEGPADAAMLRALVAMYERAGAKADADRALAAYERVAERPIEAIVLRCRLLANRGEFDEARKAANAGLEHVAAADRGALRRELVVIELKADRPAEARRHLLMLREAAPDDSDVLRQLAEIALRTGDWQELARWEDGLRALEGPASPNALYYEARRSLAEAKDGGDAKFARAAEIQKRLVAAQPDWPATRSLGAMIEEGRGNLDSAVKEYQESLRLGDRRPAVVERLFTLLDRLGRIDDAEQCLALLEEQLDDGTAGPSATAATARLRWAAALARQHRTTDAIDACRAAARADASSRTAIVLGGVLVAGHPSPGDFERAEPLLSDALRRHADDADLLAAVATVRVVQGRVDEAIALNDRALKLRPQHPMALNNQASLLAELPDRRREAMEYIDRAIDALGPKAMLLDTKAAILLYDGKPREALPLLEKAVATAKPSRPDPRWQFHLAVAYDRLGDAQKARDALRQARQGGLADQILTSTDQKLLTALEKE